MQLILEIESPNELQLILRYVRLLPTVKILTEQKKQPKPIQSAPIEQPESDFMQYVGILQTGLTVDEIDEKINKIRDYEWERERTF